MLSLPPPTQEDEAFEALHPTELLSEDLLIEAGPAMLEKGRQADGEIVWLPHLDSKRISS